MLAINNLSKKYGSHTVLKVSQLNIPSGTFWIEGGNGSGKSTFLKILAGIIPFEGTVSLNEIDLKKSPVQYREQISYAEAEPQFPPTVTGNELIQFFLSTRNADQAQVNALINHFNVSSFLNQPVGGYSSGMMKKLSILTAFIGSSKLVLLDEPLITLDVNFIPLLLTSIKDRQANGTSFLITSHQMFDENMLTFDGKLSVQDHIIRFESK